MVNIFVEAMALEIVSEGFFRCFSDLCAPGTDVYRPARLVLIKTGFLSALKLPAYNLLMDVREDVVWWKCFFFENVFFSVLKPVVLDKGIFIFLFLAD